MKKEIIYCDCCGEEITVSWYKTLTYTDDSGSYSGRSSETKTIDLCCSCNETLVTSIKQTIKSVKENQ